MRIFSNGPLDWGGMLAFFQTRQIPGVESIEAGRYCRNVRIEGASGQLEVRGDVRGVSVAISDSLIPHTVAVVARVRRMFDLDADAAAIALYLKMPQCRIPGCWDPFELAVRAVLGQQISVAAARTFAARLVAASAQDGVFPDAAAVASADLSRIGLTRSRVQTIRLLAEAVASGRMDYGFDALTDIPGIGPWTAQYVALRALKDGDAFPSSDLVLRRALGLTEAQLVARAQDWRPWRAYAAIGIWKGQLPARKMADYELPGAVK